MISKHIHKVTEKELSDAYRLFLNTLSSQHRLKIMNLLRKKPMNVSEITKKLKLDQTQVSHNLRRLRSCGFVTKKVDGKYRYYELNKKTIKPILDLIDQHMSNHCLLIVKGLKGGEK